MALILRGGSMKTAGGWLKRPKRLFPLLIVLTLVAILLPATPVMAAPQITASPSSGAIGTEVVITGTVFDSYKGDNVHIFFDGFEIDNSPQEVPQSGEFEVSYVIPATAVAGRHWFSVRSDTDVSLASDVSFVVDTISLSLDITDGAVGTSTTISGTGYYAGRTVTLYYQNVISTKIGTTTASPAGLLTYQFIVPASAGGSHQITAVDSSGRSAQAQFSVIPVLAINLTSASPGSTVNLTGSGFGYQSSLSVTFGPYVVLNIQSDDYGSFTASVEVPDLPPGLYDVTARDDKGNVDKASFTVTAAASLSQSSGGVGSTVTVRGSGFEANGNITIEYDGVTIETKKADSDGAFIAFVIIPPSLAGGHMFTISDGTTTREFTFTVEAVAPGVPVLTLPVNGSEGNACAYLDWQDVPDDSQPVYYRVQVAADANFANMVLDKEALTESEYTLSEEEALEVSGDAATFYWRVKAKDSAANEGEWSAAWSFSVSPPPPPVPLLPVSGSELESPVLLKWEASTSLSPPVTYRVQVATDANFAAIALELADLTSPEYAVPEDEETGLGKKQTYYWRVKAVDGVGNESDWSTPASFYLAAAFSFPTWATILLIVIGVIVVGFFAFRAGRRTAYDFPE
jgi:hypothetical protein